MKMHQLSQHVGGCVQGIFTDTLIISNPERVPELNKDVIGGVRISKIPESNLLLNTTPRTKQFIHEKPEKKVLKKLMDLNYKIINVVVFLELLDLANLKSVKNYRKN